MPTAAPPRPLTAQQAAAYRRDGYLQVPALIGADEVATLVAGFAGIAARGATPGLFEPRPGPDPLDRFPRIMQPHRWTALEAGRLARRFLLDARVLDILAQLMGEEPLAVQSMYYFKPPGARGQCFHQDDYYLRSDPGPCVAAWLALDDVDPGNGGLSVVPGSQDCPILPTVPADLSQSFSTDEVPIPAGLAPVPTVMKAGDLLFFNGRLLHGSTPNRSADRFRRSFICHYVPGRTATMSEWYRPQIRRDGSELELPAPVTGADTGRGD
jgi:phytanoyl-CoA hydroxylase